MACGRAETFGALSSDGGTRFAPKNETHRPQSKKRPSSCTQAIDPTQISRALRRKTPSGALSRSEAGWNAFSFVTIEWSLPYESRRFIVDAYVECTTSIA
jgi:hypothetical protein